MMIINLKYSPLIVLFLVIFFGKDTAIASGEWHAKPNQEDKLPLFKISTFKNTIVDEPKREVQLAMLVAKKIVQETEVGIEFRRSSSPIFPKKSFAFETTVAPNHYLDIFLSMYPEEDWILHASYSNKTLIRKKLIYDLSLDINPYASTSAFVELEIKYQHRGVYVFKEKLKRDPHRIEANNLKEIANFIEDLTGGYISKIDKLSASDGENGSGGYNNQNSFSSNFSPIHASGA